MSKKIAGFTLIEILIAMSILIVGLVGILALFPTGLNATRKAIEDTNAAMVAESVYASLRAAAKKTKPGGKLEFFHDGARIDSSKNKFPLAGGDFKTADLKGKAFAIPNHHYYDGSGLVRPTTEGTPVDWDKLRVIDYKASIQATSSLQPLDGDFWFLGQTAADAAYDSNRPFNITMSYEDPGQLSQYGFNIAITWRTDTAGESVDPKGLYEIAIRICRRRRLLRTFYTKLMIPTE